MIVKSFLVEKNIDELKKFKSILIYGENEGLINDIKKSFLELKITRQTKNKLLV